MSNGVIYVRVSTAEQVENFSLETQIKACKDYCARNGIDVVAVFREEGASAKTTQRPQLTEMLDYCALNAKKVEYVIVYRTDRLSRMVLDYQTIRFTLAKLKIKVRAVQETFDDTASGRLIETMMAAVAQFDNDARAARTTDGMLEALSQGRWCWQPPLGYKRPLDPRSTPSMIPDPETAELVKLAFHLVASGQAAKVEALKHVTALGLRSRKGKPLTPQSFSNMLRNTLYVGRMVVPAWEFEGPGDFEPLVREETFNRANDPKASTGAPPDTAGHVKDHPDFPLRRFVCCAECGSPVTGSWSKGRNSRYPYYRCRKTGCTAANIRKEELEELFMVHLDTLSVRPPVLDLMDAVVRDAWQERTAAQQNEQQLADKRLTSIKQRKDRLVDAYIHEARIDEQTYEEQRRRLDDQIAGTEETLQRTLPRFDQLESAIAYGKTVLTDLAGCWKRLESEKRPAFQRALYPSGVVYGDGAIGTVQKSWLLVPFDAANEQNEGLAVPTGFEPVSPP